MSSDNIQMTGGTLQFKNSSTIFGSITSDATGNLQFRGTGGNTTCTLSGFADSSANDGFVTKAYVDGIAQGIHAKDASYASTQAATTNTSGSKTSTTIVLQDGSTGGLVYSDSGNSLTVGSAAAITTSNYADIVILVRHSIDFGSGADNTIQGLYTVQDPAAATTTLTLTRITNMDADEEVPGAYTLVTHGEDAGIGYIVTTPAAGASFTLGTDPIAWTAFSSSGGGITASSTDTLTNKTINLAGNTLTGTTAEFNTALSDGSFATLAGTETLTNKTIQGATINTSSTIDASIIGGTTPAAGTFTDLVANTSLTVNAASIVMEGATANAFETTLTVTDPTADRTITFPDATGTVCTTAQSDGSLSNAIFSSGFSGSTSNAVTLNSSDSTPNQITDGETLFFVGGVSGNIYRIGNISAASGTDFTMDSSDAVNASYTLIIVKNDSGTYTAESFAITSTSGTTLSTAGAHGFTVGATANTGFLFSGGIPTLRNTTNAKLVVSGIVAASSTAITGTLTNTGSIIQTNDYIIGNNLYTNAPTAETSSFVRYASTAAAFNGSASQTISIAYDNTTINLDSSGQLQVNNVPASSLTGQITTSSQLDENTISGVALGSNLGALSFGDGISTGVDGITASSNVDSIASGRVLYFLNPADSASVNMVSVLSDYTNSTSATLTTAPTDQNNMAIMIIKTLDNTIALNPTPIGASAISGAVISLPTLNLTGNASDHLAIIVAGATVAPQFRNVNTTYLTTTAVATSTTQIEGTMTGTLTTGDIIIGAGVYTAETAADGYTEITASAQTYGTYYGQGALTLNLDIDGMTDIGADLTGTDIFIVDDGAGGTNRKCAISRIDTYVHQTTNTLTNKTLTAPRITDGSHVADDSGNEILGFTKSSGSAANHMRIVNADSGSDPEIQAEGSDSDVGLYLRTQADGIVTVNNDTTSHAIYLQSNSAGVFIGCHDGTTDDPNLMQLADQAVTVNGDFTATTVSTSSDRALKRDIEDCGGLDLVCKMRGVEWNFIKSGKHSSGVVAQELQEVAPYMVRKDKDTGMLSVHYSELSGPFINAFKDVKAELDEQRAELDELRTLIGASKKGKARKRNVNKDKDKKEEVDSDSDSDSDVTPRRYNLRRRRQRN